MAKVRVNWGPSEPGYSIKLFEVFNTSHKTIYVLARDDRTAMSVAHCANHVYSPNVKYADNYSRAAYEISQPSEELSGCWDLIQQAIE